MKLVKICIEIIIRLRWKVALLIVILGSVLAITSICLLDTMDREYPSLSIDEQLMHERLFISVRQDSLSQLAKNRGIYYSGPGFFSRRASMEIPSVPKLIEELDSLQRQFPDDLEVDDGLLLCPTKKTEGVRYVTVPVVWLIHLRFMNSSSTNKNEEEY